MKAIVPIVAALIVVAAFSQSVYQPPGHVPVRARSNWTDSYVIFPDTRDLPLMVRIQRDPRFWDQWYRRNWGGRSSGGHRNDAQATQRDWTVSLGGSAGPQNTYPAKYTFDVTAAPSCTADFVVTGVNLAGRTTQANIVGLNNLYAPGFCSGSGPAFMFAYNVGPGLVYASVTMSLDGTKLAFIENNGANTYFHVLTYKAGSGNGTDATHPAVPGTGNTAVDTKVLLGEPTTTAPFVDYLHDVAYVTTYNTGVTTGTVRKITGVFTGTPTQVTTGGWPIASTSPISTPVYDSVSQHLFFRNSAGQVRYIDTSASTAAIATNYFTLTSGADAPARPPIVDSTNGKIYAYSSGATGTNCVIGQADINLSNPVTVNVGSVTALTAFGPDLNNAYYTGDQANAYLYGVGNDSSANLRPELYRIGFGSGWRMNSAIANPALLLTTAGAAAGAFASPLTEFYNPTLNKDFLFVGITNYCSTGVPAGCIRSLDITSAFPTSGNVNSVILAATGGTSGITVDNISAQPGASSVYYLTLGANTLVKATQSGLN